MDRYNSSVLMKISITDRSLSGICTIHQVLKSSIRPRHLQEKPAWNQAGFSHSEGAARLVALNPCEQQIVAMDELFHPFAIESFGGQDGLALLAEHGAAAPF